jgi:hypothetical protein
VSEQQAEQIHSDPGSVSAGSTVPHSSETTGEASAAAALALSVLEAPATAPERETTRVDALRETTRVDALKAQAPNEASKEAPKETPKEATKTELAKPGAPRAPAKVLIMSPSDRAWHDHSAEVKVASAPNAKNEARAGAAPKPESRPGRSFLATAAMLAFATIAGAIGGAFATTGLTRFADAAATPPANGALEASIARIDSDILALKAGLEHTTKTSVSQFNKTGDRLDKIEKAQAEPNAKLARLTEAVDKLRAAPAAAPAPAAPATAAATPAAPKEVTGSVTPPVVAAATPAPSASPPPATPPRPEVARMPTVEGWTLADVGYGGALIRGRRGTYEVYAGDYVPGVGRIDAIRKQDGQWVVITSKGLITR